MFSAKRIREYLEGQVSLLLDKNNWKPIALTNEWLASIKDVPAVYILIEDGRIVYVGETGSLKGRMKDLCDSRHHNVRRNIGRKYYSKRKGYKAASSKDKFPDNIEKFVDQHITGKLKLSYLEIELGRKEVEEYIEKDLDPTYRLNIRGKRKTK